MLGFPEHRELGDSMIEQEGLRKWVHDKGALMPGDKKDYVLGDRVYVFGLRSIVTLGTKIEDGRWRIVSHDGGDSGTVYHEWWSDGAHSECGQGVYQDGGIVKIDVGGEHGDEI
jgi:hypothetical protein